jgi:hypothetical protein
MSRNLQDTPKAPILRVAPQNQASVVSAERGHFLMPSSYTRRLGSAAGAGG